MYFSKLLYYSSTIFGVTCFDSKGKFSRWRFFYVLVLALWRFPYGAMSPQLQSKQPQLLMKGMNIIVLVGHEAVIISHAYKSYVHRDVFERVYEVLSRNYHVADTKIEMVVCVIFASCMLFTVYCRIMWNPDDPNIGFAIAGVTEALIIFQFCSICRSAARGNKQLTMERVKEHCTRLHVLKEANMAYGPQIFFKFVMLVGFITVLFYRYVIYCWSGNQMCGPHYRSFLQTITFTKLSIAFLLVICCELAENQVLGFHDYLSKLMRENPHLNRNKRLSLILSMDESVQFTACGFFRLGYPLVTSVIAAASTYTIVIFQLSQTDDVQCRVLQKACRIGKV